MARLHWPSLGSILGGVLISWTRLPGGRGQEPGSTGRAPPLHPARGGRWSSWERNSQVLFPGQAWKVPNPCLTWNFYAWPSGSDFPRRDHHNPHTPHPHPSPHIDLSPAPSSAVQSSSPFFLSHLSGFLTTRKVTLLYFLTSTKASSPCIQ